MKVRMFVTVLALGLFVSGVAWHVTAQAPNPEVVWEQDLNLTPEIGEWVESRKMEPGIHIGEFDELRIVLVADGQRQTAGYELKITEVTKGDAGWLVQVERSEPGSDDMLAQVITYPHALVGIGGDQEIRIRVLDADTGEEWTPEGGAFTQ